MHKFDQKELSALTAGIVASAWKPSPDDSVNQKRFEVALMVCQTSEETRKEILRKKSDGEKYNPLKTAFMAVGMSEKTAGVRESNIRTIVAAYFAGASQKIENSGGFDNAVEVAMAHKKALSDDKAAKEAKAERIAMLGTIADSAPDDATKADLEHMAEYALAEKAGKEKREKQVDFARKVAEKAGFHLIPMGLDIPGLVAFLVGMFADDAEEVAEGMLLKIRTEDVPINSIAGNVETLEWATEQA